MYLEKVIYENVGPLSSIHIAFPFEESGEPKPVIFVGENGSGKSTLLSNVVDAFYEMAGKAFDNAQQESGRNAHQYYKSISRIQIRYGQPYMFSYLSFKDNESFFYLCKSGDIKADTVQQRIDIFDKSIKWDDGENFKTTNIDKKHAESIWDKNAICYFGPDRYERPVWMGNKYYESNSFLHPTIHQRVSGYLDKPISIKDVTSSNLMWLLDVIADSRPDITNEGDSLSIAHVSKSDLLLLGQARNNLEAILSNIIGEEVYFALNFRNQGPDRFKIVRKKDNVVVAPTLDSLSTGQIALFNLFSTIVRYGDFNDINKSIQLSNIEGIVVIDEVELHLHTKLQKEVLPKLLKMFPKVQFIITTHAPLFLLGMKETFGEEHFDVYELPTSTRITTEKFSEFQRAYEYLKETEAYSHDVDLAIKAIQPKEKAIVITEGSTDWKHMKAAFENLKAGGLHQELLDGLDFEFLEYEPAESAEEAALKLKMGNSVLCDICANISKLPQPVKYIFIADRDDKETNKKLSTHDKKFKNWGNNVFSLILPVPAHRESTPDICIEHYYTDNEIKTLWKDPDTGISRRLFIGNEFDDRGLSVSLDRFCENKKKCGQNSIAIINGSSGEKVTKIQDDGINYALPKSKFANLILEKQSPFDNFNFNSFIALFEIIKEIINQPDQVSSNDGQGS